MADKKGRHHTKCSLAGERAPAVVTNLKTESNRDGAR